ncbi:MAG: adenine deaminase [Candidatus Izimaplasma sp.]|nr:adenine deaminase [Candidatus Izimaplasma bacterium]
MDTIKLVEVARGDVLADLVLKNCKIINVFTSKIEQNDIAITDGIIVGIGSYKGVKEIDFNNRFVAPGFIDGHVHIESSMLTPPQFAKIIVPKGTTTIVADPHEIANVSGVEGIKYMIFSSIFGPLNVNIMIPSCVPATAFETSGAIISSNDINKIKDTKGVLGLGEVMNYPGVIFGDPEVHKKLEYMADFVKDGHAPSVTGKQLNAYKLSGIKTDHECTIVEELEEKVARGMYIHLREGSATRNVKVLSKGVTKENSRWLLFCTDDKHSEDIAKEGHINFNIKLAIENGVDPITAIQMATINTATCYHLDKIGAIAPGYNADLVVFDSLKEIDIDEVFIKGELVAKGNKALFDPVLYTNGYVTDTVNIKNSNKISFDIKLKNNKVKVIQLIPKNVTTTKVIREVTIENGIYKNDNSVDILKLAVVERHHQTGNVGLGLVEGYGLKNGAVAMTISHDSHNLIIIGDNDNDMKIAMKEIERIQGGITLVNNGKIIDSIRLEVAGLMTNTDVKEIEQKLNFMDKKAREMGVNKKVDDAFLSLAFMSLPVIPELKLTDKGLFDVTEFKLVSLEE